MLTIALVSQKGGSGKTTLAVHIGAELASRGKKVLLIDLDPQASASKWADRRTDLPPDVTSEHASQLEKALKAAHARSYDVTVLDTSPHQGHASLQAARAADVVLVPCRPATFDLDALRDTLDGCKLAGREPTVVLNAAPIRSRVITDAAQAITQAGAQVSPTIIRQRVALQHCLAFGQTAAEYEPGGAAAQEIAELCATAGLLAI